VLNAYVINLARSPDRRAHIVAQLKTTGLACEMVEGIDARGLDIVGSNLVTPELLALGSFRPGAAGSALSHLRAQRKILGSGLEQALVLEDDVVLPPDLAPLAGAVAEQMSGAEVVLLNFHRPGRVQLSTIDARELPSSRLLAYPADLSDLTSGGAYLITREACERMQRAAPPIRTYPDNWEFFARAGILDSVRCVAPMPVTNSPAFRTTIDYYPPNSLQSRVRETISRTRVPLLYQALVYRRMREYRKRGWTGETELVDVPHIAAAGQLVTRGTRS
jgi:glycosyl transferase family 25